MTSNIKLPTINSVATLAIILSTISTCYGQVINTVVGSLVTGYSGDGGTATAAKLNNVYSVAVNNNDGSIYIAEFTNNCVRKITAAGIISTFAGTGISGYSGDGNAATNAKLKNPTSVAVDSAGNVYISDFNNCAIRKVDRTGIISTYAGTGACGFSGDGGPASNARIRGPHGLATDAAGNLYITDYYNNRIRRINRSGIIKTIAGVTSSGFSGDGGPATAAQLNGPRGVAFDNNSGCIYIADLFNQRIRVVNPSGVIQTFAGTGTVGYTGNGGPATAARVNTPISVAVNSNGDVFISEASNYIIRKVDHSTGIISPFAGCNINGYTGDGSAATDAKLSAICIAFDANDNLYLTGSSTVRKVDSRLYPINGSTTICESSTGVLTNSLAGGRWSSNNPAVLPVTPYSGHISGNAPGVAIITYTPYGKYATFATLTDTVLPLPIVAPITGGSGICTGASILLANPDSFGVWSSGNTSLAAVDTDGVVTALSAGLVPISYTVTNNCGSKSVSKAVFVYAPVTPDVIVHTLHDTAKYQGEIMAVEAVATYGGLNPAYQWYLNDEIVPGATSNTYSVETYWKQSMFCVLSSSLSCITKSTDTSATLLLYPKPLAVNNILNENLQAIAPNPNNGKFSIQLNNNGPIDISICNLTGQVVHKGILTPFSNNMYALDLSDVLGAGLYVLKISNNYINKTLQLQIEK